MPPRRGRRQRRHGSANDDDDTGSSVVEDDSRAAPAAAAAAPAAEPPRATQLDSMETLLELISRQEERIKALESDASSQPRLVSVLAGRLSLEDTVLIFDLLSLRDLLANDNVEEAQERIDDMLEDIEIRATMSMSLWADGVNERLLADLSDRECELQENFIADRLEAWKNDPIKKNWVALASHPWRPRSTAEMSEAPISSRRSRRQGKKDSTKKESK